MLIISAYEKENRLEVVVDGHRMWAGEKYSPLEWGYAFYFLIENDEIWLKANGEVLPADPAESRGEMGSGNRRFITSNPILVALAINSYWYHEKSSTSKQVEIPTLSQAVEIVRNRRILSESNKMWMHYVPGLEKSSSTISPWKNYRKKSSDQENRNVDYRKRLIENFWYYQQKHFSETQYVFDEVTRSNNRPPVFLPKFAWKNIILKPGSREQEISELKNLIPEGEFHKWFRSMNSSQALALSILGNLVIHKSIGVINELKEDDSESLFGNAILSQETFSMERKIRYLGEPRSTSLDVFFQVIIGLR